MFYFIIFSLPITHDKSNMAIDSIQWNKDYKNSFLEESIEGK